MKAVRVPEHGGPEVLVVEDVADPVPGAGEVLIRVRAVGVNFVDVYNRSGLDPSAVPHTPGAEGAGEVVAVGDGVDAAWIGQRVASTSLAGAYAELATAPADRIVTLPDDVDAEIAAAALLQGMTAHYLLHDSYP